MCLFEVAHFVPAKPFYEQGLGGFSHAVIGPDQLEDTAAGFLFAFQWSARFRVSAILGVHLLFLGLGSSALARLSLLLRWSL